MVCILSIILPIFKVQLDFSPKEVKQLYSGCTNVLDSHSLLDAYKNSYLKYLPKNFSYLDYDSSKKQESTKEKLHTTGEFTGKSGCGSTVSLMPFNAKKVLNSNNIDQPSTVNWGTTCAVSYDHQLQC